MSETKIKEYKTKLSTNLDKSLNSVETEVKQKIKLKASLSNDIKKAEGQVEFMRKNGFTEEELAPFIERIEALKAIKLDKKFILIPENKMKKIKKAAMIGTLTAALAGVGGITITSCAKNASKVAIEKEIDTKDDDLNVVPIVETTIETVDTEIVPETVVVDSMSENIEAFGNTTAEAINSALTAGINVSLDKELTEADKETYARLFTQYRIVANLDNFTNLEYAEMFGETLNPTEDLVESFFEINTLIKKQLIVVSTNSMLDYSYLYNSAKDAEVLNKSQELIALMNEANTKDSRLEAAKNWYSYVVSVLTSTEGNIALSSQALDTLITHSEAFDELTRQSFANIQGAHIDDELEHYFNIAKDACLDVALNNENLEVEERGIANLKSIFRISFINKLNEKYESAKEERTLQLNAGKELNTNNAFGKIVEYVTSLVDLTKYVEAPSYIEKLEELAGVNNINENHQTVTTKTDRGGHREEKNETPKEEKPPRYEDKDENPIVPPDVDKDGDKDKEDIILTFQDGYSVGNEAGAAGKDKPSHIKGNTAYNNGLDMGYEDGLAIYNQYHNMPPEVEFVPIEEKEEFVPVEEKDEVVSYSNESSKEEQTQSNEELKPEQTQQKEETPVVVPDDNRYFGIEEEFVPLEASFESCGATPVNSNEETEVVSYQSDIDELLEMRAQLLDLYQIEEETFTK